MSIEKDFVPYQESFELKELGFDEPCFAYYRDNRISGVNRWNREDWEFHVISNKDITSITNEIVLAPTFSQCFKWFREKFNLKSFIQPIPDDVDTYIFAYGSKEIEHDDEDYLTHEEAELACLKKLIEIVKEKQHVNIN